MNKEISNIRIVDIAELAGVSVGTVDRVIHNRGRVSEENQRKVRAVLEEVHYQPNLVARSLASKKQYRFVAVTPSFEPGEYWEAISEGIDKAASEAEMYNVSVDKLFFDQYDNRTFDAVVQQLLGADEIDGVLIATLFTDSVVHLSRQLDARDIPYIYVDSNIEGEHQLAYFGTESYDAGQIAAKLLLGQIDNRADILMSRIVPCGKNDSNQGKNRKEGFLRYLDKQGFAGKIREVELRFADAAYNESQLDEVFRAADARIEGAVIFNSACYILGDYLQKRGLGDVRLVGYDLIGKNTRLLSEGVISALIAQRPEQQGYEGIRSLCRYSVQKQRPDPINLMPIDILFKENLSYYLNKKL